MGIDFEHGTYIEKQQSVGNSSSMMCISQVLEKTSYDGTMVWKITDYSRRKRDAESGKTLSFYSHPFYTSRHGYKMCARISLNGEGAG